MRPHNSRQEQPDPEPGNVGMRACSERDAPSGPGTPDSTGSRSPETEPDGLPVRGRLPRRRPKSRATPEHDKVILSGQDLAVIWKAVALARQDGNDDQQDAVAAGQPGPGPGLPAEEPWATRPPEPRHSAPPLATAQAPPAANPTPPWGTRLTITVRSWARQQFVAAPRRWRVISALILAAVLFSGGAITVALTRNSTAGKGPAGGGQPPGDASIAAAAADRSAAAGWVTRQIAPAAIVACDPQMCATLQRNGIPAGRLLVLGTGNAGPLGSDVIMSTAAVRAEFGSRLTSVYAPVALATFGSGSAQVAVRVVAADGSSAYLRNLHADATARRAVGAQLLRNPHVRVSPACRRELAAGQVDTRLLSVIGAVATPYRVDITDLAKPAAGVSPGVPLRSADLSPTPLGRERGGATLDAVKRFLLHQQTPFRPAGVTIVRLASGQSVLRVEFTAPSPLGLLGAP